MFSDIKAEFDWELFDFSSDSLEGERGDSTGSIIQRNRIQNTFSPVYLPCLTLSLLSPTSWLTGSNGWGLRENQHSSSQTSSTGSPSKDACSPPCSSSSTPMSASHDTLLSNSHWFQSEQREAAHAQNCGDNCGSPPTLTLITTLSNTVLTVDSFRFLGSTISEGVRRTPNITSEVALPASWMSITIIHFVCSLLFSHPVAWVGHQTGQEQTTAEHKDCRKIHSSSLMPTWPSFRTHTPPDWGNGQVASLQTPRILDTTRVSFSPHGGAPDLGTVKQLDMKTAFSCTLLNTLSNC